MEMVMGGDRVLVLSCDKWRMTDDKTGEMREGWSMWYVSDYREDEPEAFGLKPVKISLRDEQMALSLRGKLPCLAEFQMGSRPGPKNTAAAFVRAITVTQPNLDVTGAQVVKKAA